VCFLCLIFLPLLANYNFDMIFRDLKDSLSEYIGESPVLSFIFNKKLIAVASFIILVLFFIGWFFSTRPKLVSCSEPGRMPSFYNLKEWSKMKRLTVEGMVDDTDLAFLNLYASSLEVLDLSAANLKSIPDSAFVNSSSLKQVILPETLVSLGKSVFSGCSRLSDVALPPRVVEIGDDAFYGTSVSSFVIPSTLKRVGAGAFASNRLSKISVAEGNCSFKVVDNVLFNSDNSVLIQYPAMKDNDEFVVPAGVKLIMSNAFAGARKLSNVSFRSEKIAFGDGVFKNCASLHSFNFPCCIDTIPSSFFEGCVALARVKVSPSLKMVSDYAFWNCPNLKDIQLPKSVDVVGDFAFAYCKSLSGVDISSVKQLGRFAFAYCVGLNAITIPNSVKSIGESAFCNCENLCKLVVPSSVKQIGDNAFSGCFSLVEVKLDEGLEGLGAMAFSSCSSLEVIELPASLTYIYGDCFNGCTKLSSLSVKAVLPPECRNAFPAPLTTNCTLYTPYSSIPRYQFEDGWNKFFRVQSLTK